MISFWKTASVFLCDLSLGWTLSLPRDLALVLIAVLMALLLVFVRRCVTNQPLLKDQATDRRQLSRLIREARQEGRASDVARFKNTRLRIATIRMREELKPAAVMLLPFAMLITWMSARFEYLPPQAGEQIVLEVHAPVSRLGDIAHLVPESEMNSENGWIQLLDVKERDDRPFAYAKWVIQAEQYDEPYQLTMRCGNTNLVHPLMVGSTRYSPPTISHRRDWKTQITLRRYQPFGIFPESSNVPAWLIAYTVLLLVCYYLFRATCRVA